MENQTEDLSYYFIVGIGIGIFLMLYTLIALFTGHIYKQISDLLTIAIIPIIGTAFLMVVEYQDRKIRYTPEYAQGFADYPERSHYVSLSNIKGENKLAGLYCLGYEAARKVDEAREADVKQKRKDEESKKLIDELHARMK